MGIKSLNRNKINERELNFELLKAIRFYGFRSIITKIADIK